MIDILKAITKDQEHIHRLYSFALTSLTPCKPQNDNYVSFNNGYGRFALHFRKCRARGSGNEFFHVEFRFSPHYYYNNNLHNGNDFAPFDCARTIEEVFMEMGVQRNKLQDFKVVNLEYGVNLITGFKIESIIDGVLFTKKSIFKVEEPEFPYSKISDTSKYKQIKAYGKGLMFTDAPEYGIDKDTFRYEIKSKESKFIKTLGIKTVEDLLNLDVYNNLAQSLLDEWENLLIVNLNENNKENTPEFWQNIIRHRNRNKFNEQKIEYKFYNGQNKSLHFLIKCKIIDKITSLMIYANSTGETAINREKLNFEKTPVNRINLENAYLKDHYIIPKEKKCEVTGLDISAQKENSRYLCLTGLKELLTNEPEKFQELEDKFLTEKTVSLPNLEKMYYIAHNIRNIVSNKIHNQRRFEQNNYHPNQLQFNF